jgi:hypothetical protein
VWKYELSRSVKCPEVAQVPRTASGYTVDLYRTRVCSDFVTGREKVPCSDSACACMGNMHDVMICVAGQGSCIATVSWCPKHMRESHRQVNPDKTKGCAFGMLPLGLAKCLGK